jgi:hypothetical protein
MADSGTMQGISSIIGAVKGGGGGSGGGSSSGMGMSIGGMAEQDIAGYLGSMLSTREVDRGINKAGDKLTQGYNEAKGYYQPYYNPSDFTSLRDMILSGQFDSPAFQHAQEQNYGNYTPDAFKFEQDPGYQFRMQEGQRAINQSAAARGSMLSPATVKALQQYSSGLASQEYGAANDRYNVNRQFGANQFDQNRQYASDLYGRGYDRARQSYTDILNSKTGQYNRMTSLANVGLGAAGELSGLTSDYFGNRANLELQRGANRAGGYKSGAEVGQQQGQHLQEIGSSYGGTKGGGTQGESGGLSSVYQPSSINGTGQTTQDTQMTSTGYYMPQQQYYQPPQQQPSYAPRYDNDTRWS